MKVKRFSAAFLLMAFAVLLASCRAGEPGETAPGTSDTPAASAAVTAVPGSGVWTDFSVLTPYKPLEEVYTRLSDGPMTELVPSDDYGALLPYTGIKVFSENGYELAGLKGLVTRDGMIVTDPVYATVYRMAVYDQGEGESEEKPAYVLSGTYEDSPDDSYTAPFMAACALDGSWITPFVYSDIFSSGDAMILVRDAEKNDWDVMDYDGNLLYNSKDMDWSGMLPEWSCYLAYNNSGGFIETQLRDGTIVYINVVTGELTRTDFSEAMAFSDGLAAVSVGGLWGYVNTDFTFVIEPQYMTADPFVGKRAVVRTTDGDYVLIDKSGQQLIVSAEGAISNWYSDSYCVYDAYGNPEKYYDYDLNGYDAWMDDHQLTQVTPLANGWYYYQNASGVVLFSKTQEYALPGIENISNISGDLVSHYAVGNNWKEGVVNLSGEEIVPPTEDATITFVENSAGKTYIVLCTYGVRDTYQILDEKGSVLFSGGGSAYYNSAENLFEINGTYSYGYMNPEGDFIFRISLMDDIPD